MKTLKTIDLRKIYGKNDSEVKRLYEDTNINNNTCFNNSRN